MFAEKDQNYVIGYMDLTDFECELGAAKGGNRVFSSIEDCKKNKKNCIEECGIVEVKVEAIRIIQEPIDFFKRYYQKKTEFDRGH